MKTIQDEITEVGDVASLDDLDHAIGRRFAAWCARQVQHLMTDLRSLAALDVAERQADGLATTEELEAAWTAANEAAFDAEIRRGHAGRSMESEAEAAAACAARSACGQAPGHRRETSDAAAFAAGFAAGPDDAAQSEARRKAWLAQAEWLRAAAHGAA